MNIDNTCHQQGQSNTPRRLGLVQCSSCSSTAYYDEMAEFRFQERKRAQAQEQAEAALHN